jgi:hypothetical protein
MPTKTPPTARTYIIHTYRSPSSVATGRGEQDIGGAGGKTISPAPSTAYKEQVWSRRGALADQRAPRLPEAARAFLRLAAAPAPGSEGTPYAVMLVANSVKRGRPEEARAAYRRFIRARKTPTPSFSLASRRPEGGSKRSASRRPQTEAGREAISVSRVASIPLPSHNRLPIGPGL